MVLHPQTACIKALISHDLEPAIYCQSFFVAFCEEIRQEKKKSYPLHVKLNSGMNRLGFRESDLEDLTGLLRTSKDIVEIKSIFFSSCSK
ncbi:MAG: alanine racemase [Flavobacteriaceae bacterium]|nr:alanine racemase [Flavobacteriaceae bacterium]